jgi:hypothetical protein
VAVPAWSSPGSSWLVPAIRIIEVQCLPVEIAGDKPGDDEFARHKFCPEFEFHKVCPVTLALDNPFSALSFPAMGTAISPRGDMLKNRVPLATQGRTHALDNYNFR